MNSMRDVFDARKYLKEYFTAPSEEDRFALSFWIEQIRHLPPGVRVLEYGGGPTLYSVLALARQASSIHFSDYVPSALIEVRKWIAGEPDAHDWRPYTRYILHLEQSPNGDVGAAARENALRRSMAHLSECDATTDAMLADPRPLYDVITAHHCLDVAARDLADFKRMVRRLAGWLAPGGLFLLSITTGTLIYTVEETQYPCLDLTQEQLHETFIETGMDPQRISVASMPIEGQEYTGITLSSAWKQ